MSAYLNLVREFVGVGVDNRRELGTALLLLGGAFYNIGPRHLIQKYFQDDIIHDELTFIPRHFRENLGMLEFIPTPCPSFIQMAYYYASIANAIYNKWALEYFRGPGLWLEELYLEPESKTNRPSFGYFIDHYRQTLVIAVRGTTFGSDMATDARLKSQPVDEASLKLTPDDYAFDIIPEIVKDLPAGAKPPKVPEEDYLAHHGFMQSARNILNDANHPFIKDIYPRVTQKMGFAPQIYVTGHSLGASTSACIVFLLRKHNYDARGVLFAPAPCFSQQLIEDNPDACKNYIVCFINRFDLITRAEAGIIERSVIVAAGKTSALQSAKEQYVNLLAAEANHKTQAAQRFEKLFPDLKPEDIRILAEEHHTSVESMQEACAAYLKLRHAHAKRRVPECNLIKLATPGRSYWIHYGCGRDGNAPTVGLYKIKSNDFFNFLPLVCGPVIAKTPHDFSNPGTDHKMNHYCAYLYAMYRALTQGQKQQKEPASELAEEAQAIDAFIEKK